MRHAILVLAVLAIPLSSPALQAQCVASHRGDGTYSYDAIQLQFTSAWSSTKKTDMRHGYDAWNSSSSCNIGGTAFPRFQEIPDGASRTITVHYVAGFGPDEIECGTLSGNDILIYEKARIDGTVQFCTRSGVIDDVMAHELGHVLGLTDQYSSCSNYIMSQVGFTSSSTYIDRRIQSAECQKVDTTHYTITEQELDYCDANPDDPDCSGLDDCEPYDCSSPIVIDLDGRGFWLSSLANGVWFDIDADGIAERTTWSHRGSRDAFLVLDRNGNGRVDDGQELFGNRTRFKNGNLAPNGYDVLAELEITEGNGDGLIDSADPVYWDLLVWWDRNHDAVSQPAELLTLEKAGIVGLSVVYRVSFDRDEHGNRLRYQSFAFVLHGSTIETVGTADVFFVVQQE